ncbi:hypothetical protein R0135_09875 [Congregibacter variabilis]|uniref:Uncharacterized protein n=1 Tax=Congregibacter variabilis TaxID=3081200 RepID=A0ABZ0HXX6_9GAMM|nr:hypothetical protein R0135_09875 [Congregibacter sp. IMCC43200]
MSTPEGDGIPTPGLVLTGSRALGFLAAFLLVLLSACTSTPQPSTPDSCRGRYLAFEEFAAQQGVSLSDPRRVAGFPSLGTNRSLASFDPLLLTQVQRADWFARLQAAGVERRQLLNTMLADSVAHSPLSEWLAGLDLQSCDGQNQLAAKDDTLDWEALWAAAQVEDDYIAARRVLGLYPLSSIFAGLGIQALQAKIHDSYALPLSEIPRQGRLLRYSPADSAGAAKSKQDTAFVLNKLDRDSLGLRLDQHTNGLLTGLFLHHAPTLEIDEVGSYDIPGKPYFDAEGAPRVSSESTYAYHYASLMPFAGKLRLQLNYVFWFDERPPENAMDSLSGSLDGLVWRATLDEHGEVLLYDSIHPCGCYQQFFLTDRVEARAENAALREPPLIPQKAPSADGPVLRISSGSHYLQRVYSSTADAAHDLSSRRYELVSYSDLYSLDSAEGSRTLFDANGLVPGTQRGERFYLWPMGIRSPGAMRERGRQPTAFVGRRHFDDADLLDKLFKQVQP